MEITDIQRRCWQIASTIGPAASISVVIASDAMRPCSALVYKSKSASATFVYGETWPELFSALDRKARELAQLTRAGDAEYESWSQPAPALAAE